MSQIGTDPVARRLFQGNEAEDDLRYKRIVEPYVIDNLPSGDINSAVFTEAHFPAKGSPHPDVEEAVLVSRRLVGRINQNQCLYLLTYRSNLPFGAAFRGASSSTNATRQITAPRWQQYTIDIGGASSGLRFSLQGESLERVFATQSFTVEITGLTALQVQ
ncbi:MAG: hypothetical protein HRU13_12965, partial [Phycisphaerales bacterium]|nr:hypothetical protein [Phycisphaerales bacterium]